MEDDKRRQLIRWRKSSRVAIKDIAQLGEGRTEVASMTRGIGDWKQKVADEGEMTPAKRGREGRKQK
jgi:hypothetical protein